MRTTTKRVAVSVALIGGLVLLVRARRRAKRVLRYRLHVVTGRLRDVAGRLHGLSYRLRRRHPDPDVADRVLADRVRSSLGPLEKRLDVPRVHVMVEHDVVLLHGDVGAQTEADEIEAAVAAISGVGGVESHLHVGLTAGDTRPSAGRSVEQPSHARRRLLDAATHAGLDSQVAALALGAILAAFAEQLPDGERKHVAAHLPADVRAMFVPNRGTRQPPPTRTSSELIDRVVAATPQVPRDLAHKATSAVLAEMRDLVRDEAADIAAVLPAELRQFWDQAPHSLTR